MKRVSFPVAKALKEAGYPIDDRAIKEAEIFVSHTGIDTYCLLPTCIEVWLWLWRENIARIVIGSNTTCIWYNENYYEPMTVAHNNDPEEAIDAALEYLVKNNLIK